jgi:hypothetical protein
VLLPLQVNFLRDVVEKLLLSVLAFSMFHLAQVPCDVLGGGEGFFTCFIFLVTFHREQSLHSVGVRPCKNVWMQ